MPGSSGSSGNSSEDVSYTKPDKDKCESRQCNVLLRFSFRKTYFLLFDFFRVHNTVTKKVSLT